MKIYKRTNNVNGKLYFGITDKSLTERFNQHYYNRKSHISIALRKYGRDNFSISLIDDVEDKSYAGEIEKKLIREFDTRDRTKGYNKQPGGQFTSPEKHPNRVGMLGKTHNEESKKLMSENHYDVNGDKNPFYGKNHSEATKKLISDKNKGKTRSNEYKEHRSLQVRGANNPNSKTIIIYNSCDEVVDVVVGGIKKYINDKGLPISLASTYRNNTTLKKGEYKGWYCKIKE